MRGMLRRDWRGRGGQDRAGGSLGTLVQHPHEMDGSAPNPGAEDQAQRVAAGLRGVLE